MPWHERYPGFVLNPDAPLLDEFQRLANLRGWTEGSKRYRKVWRECLVEEFGARFGHEEGRLAGWQDLCIEVGIRNVPLSITGCKKALRSVSVNLVDLIDCRGTGRKVKLHKSKKALREYILETKKIFPKEAAKRNGFLNALLITVFA